MVWLPLVVRGMSRHRHGMARPCLLSRHIAATGPSIAAHCRYGRAAMTALGRGHAGRPRCQGAKPASQDRAAPAEPRSPEKSRRSWYRPGPRYRCLSQADQDARSRRSPGMTVWEWLTAGYVPEQPPPSAPRSPPTRVSGSRSLAVRTRCSPARTFLRNSAQPARYPERIAQPNTAAPRRVSQARPDRSPRAGASSPPAVRRRERLPANRGCLADRP